MDRLSTLIAIAALAGCESKSSAPPAGRANVAKVSGTQAATAEAFCDSHFKDDTGPVVRLPAVVDGTLPAKVNGWRWINVWATWCKPCVEEMPRLVRWRDKLTASGDAFDLAFISVDDDPADVAALRKEHPALPPSVRLAEPAKQAEFYASLGLDASVTIPIHVVVRPSGHVACIRSGGVREADFAAIEKLLAH